MQIQATFGVASPFPEPSALSWSPRNIPRFRLLTLIFACSLVSGARTELNLQPVSDSPYQLHFFHTHTRERLIIIYRDGKGYRHESLARLNRYLRDHRTGERFVSTILEYSTSSTS